MGDVSPFIIFAGVSSDNTSAANIRNNIENITAQYNIEDANYIDVIDERASLNNLTTTFELYKVHYGDWLDRDGNAFGDTQAVVDYINEEVTVGSNNLIGESQLARTATGLPDTILCSAGSPFTYTATYSNGIGYFWDESSFPAGVEVSRFDQRKISGTIAQIGTYTINFEITNKNGILPTNVTIQVL